MTTASWITLVLLIAMFVMLVWNRFPIWLVFIGTLTAAMTLQLAASRMFSRRHEHQLVEVVLSARSPAIGHKIGDLPLPDSPYQLMPVGVSRLWVLVLCATSLFFVPLWWLFQSIF